MNPSLFLAAFCLGIASAALTRDHSLDAQWIKWKAKHKKLYGMNEEGWRRAVWEKNMKMIEQHNQEYSQGKHSFTMAMNAFGDMTNGEFRQVMNGGGLDSEASYPYEGKVKTCRYNPKYSVANDTGFVDIPSREKDLAKAVATVGPISVAVDASHFSFQFYKKGIYFEPRCDPEGLDHAMLAVGYGYEGADSDNNKYWLVKNRTGKNWGMDGYIKMAKDRRNNCGIATAASYPTV
ncbi:hypothetical protein EGK_13355 [Macaca mulatta]|uniref:Cathepsin L1 n=1 Tax=Macaca mulatta TaxID=9544 RepID=G7MNB5_MACMU|nr:hypothetical protein EGK_13355 [Macaca mulatta]